MFKKFKLASIGIAWCIVLIVIVIMSFEQNLETGMFYGIAESNEVKISNEHAVEIRRIAVVGSQPVKKGDTLAVLDRQDLPLKLNDITHQLEQFRTAEKDRIRELNSKIDRLKAEKEQKTSDVKSEIMQIKAQLSMNQKMTSGLASLGDGNIKPGIDTQSPLTVKLQNLEDQLKLITHPFDLQIAQAETELTSPSTEKIQIEKLEQEIVLVEKEKKDLIVFSPIDGIVGSVDHRQGEQVSAFSPILTIHSRAPSQIEGYIHEDVYNSITVGQKVSVISNADRKHSVVGTVAGVGTRIVEYPVRLRKRPDIQIWGREVIIKIPEQNSLLLGEKVMVSAK